MCEKTLLSPGEHGACSCFPTPVHTVLHVNNNAIIAVISVAPYLTDKGEHASLYKINDNTFIQISNIINYVVMILYTSCALACTHTHTQARTHTHTHVHTCTHTHTHTHTLVHRRNVTRGKGYIQVQCHQPSSSSKNALFVSLSLPQTELGGTGEAPLLARRTGGPGQGVCDISGHGGPCHPGHSEQHF